MSCTICVQVPYDCIGIAVDDSEPSLAAGPATLVVLSEAHHTLFEFLLEEYVSGSLFPRVSALGESTDRFLECIQQVAWELDIPMVRIDALNAMC